MWPNEMGVLKVWNKKFYYNIFERNCKKNEEEELNVECELENLEKTI